MSLRRAKIGKMAKYPYCFYCGRKLSLEGKVRNGKLPPDYPTIEHIHSRFFGERPKEGLQVLACEECNARKNKEDRQKHPLRHKWLCAGFPFYLAPLNWYLRWHRGYRRIVRKEDFNIKRWKLFRVG